MEQKPIRVVIQTRRNVLYDEQGCHAEPDLDEELFATPREIAARLRELAYPHTDNNRLYGTLVYLTLDGHERRYNGWFSFSLYHENGRTEGRIFTGNAMDCKRPVEMINEAIQELNGELEQAA